MRDSLKLDWRETFDLFRKMITAIPSAQENTARRCPECNDKLDLIYGRRAGKWWYVHRFCDDCIYSGHKSRIRFETQQEAETTEKIFKISGA
jgi:ssDNA-binding Zn-finger/Zn-ribbon topoisomerase 1